MTPARRGALARLAAGCAYLVLIAGQYQIPLSGPPGPSYLPIALLGTPALLAILLGPLVLAIRTVPDGRVLSPAYIATACFFAVVLLSSLWSDAGEATWLQATWILMLLAALMVVSAAVQLAPVAAIDSFMLLGAMTGIVFAVAGLLGEVTGGRIAAFGGGPNVFARITGIGMIAALYWMLRSGRSWPVVLSAVPLMGVATVLSGSRGAMLATVCGLLAISTALTGRTWRRVATCALVLGPVLIVLYRTYGTELQSVIERRIVQLTIEAGYTAGRGGLWSSAVAMFGDNPLAGAGLGTFIDRYGFYTHNLVIQVVVDAGAFGLIALVVALGTVARRICGRQIRRPLVMGPLAASILVLVASMFSGDYYDTRFFWSYLILAAAAAATATTKSGGVVADINGPWNGPAVARPTSPVAANIDPHSVSRDLGPSGNDETPRLALPRKESG